MRRRTIFIIYYYYTKYCGCYFSKQSSCIYSFVPDYTTSTQINLQAKKMKQQSNGETTKMQPVRTSSTLIGTTKWLALKTIDYSDQEGKARKWDIATRTTKQPNVPDAVVIIPILRSQKSTSIDTILVEQYRPPIESIALEFPAGLIDEGETAQQAALRELWEETGYVGIVDDTFSDAQLSMSPGLTDETIQIIIVNVDLDDPRNVKPKQHQDEGEFIDVKRVPLTVGLKDMLNTSTSMPISLLYSFAIGLEMGAKLSNTS